VNGFVFADLVRDGTATRANGASNQRAFAAAGESANRGSTSSRASDHLETGVMSMIVCSLGRLGALVGSLSDGSEGQGARKSKAK